MSRWVSAAAAALAAVLLLVLLPVLLLASGSGAGTAAAAQAPCLAPSPTASTPTTPAPTSSASDITPPPPVPPTGARLDFAMQLLAGVNAPAIPNNLGLLSAWMMAESGPDTGSPQLSKAHYNPLNTTMREPGSWDFNGVGVQNYPDFSTGVTATVSTLTLSAYNAVVAALRADAPPITIAQAILSSGWGTGPQLLELVGGSVPPCPIGPITGDIAPVITFAEAQLGDPYVWGGAGPDRWDCSGLTMAAYATIGLTLPHSSELQFTYGAPVADPSELAPGDLVFWAGSDGTVSSPGHVGLYLGNGLVLDAPHTGTVVQIQPMWWNGYAGARRLVTTPAVRPTP